MWPGHAVKLPSVVLSRCLGSWVCWVACRVASSALVDALPLGDAMHYHLVMQGKPCTGVWPTCIRCFGYMRVVRKEIAERVLALEDGEFVLFTEDDGEVQGGIATNEQSEGVDIVVVEMCARNDSGVSWLPMWAPTDDSDIGFKRCKKCPAPNYGRMMKGINKEQITMVGGLSTTWRITEETRKTMQLLRVID